MALKSLIGYVHIYAPTGFHFSCFYLPFTIGGAAILTLIFLLMPTIGGATGVIPGNSVVDIALRDTYYVVDHFNFVLSLGVVIAIFSGIMYLQD